MIRLGKFFKEMLLYSGAEQIYQQTLQRLSTTFRNNPMNESIAKVNYLLAQLFWNQGKWEISEPYCLESLRIREQVWGSNHSKVAKCLTGLGGKATIIQNDLVIGSFHSINVYDMIILIIISS